MTKTTDQHNSALQSPLNGHSHTPSGVNASPSNQAGPHEVMPEHRNGASDFGGCTQAQLRRFIKSRPYVPMHELRRRFELNGEADDVTPIRTSSGVVFVGLPTRESSFIEELIGLGEIDVELCHDPVVSIVVGVFATRPIAR